MTTGAICTLVTGTPGAGKTSYAVSLIQQFVSKNPGRKLYVMGIPELVIPHEPVPSVDKWTVVKPHPDDPSLDYPEYTFDDGSLVVIDEAQNVFRPRASVSKVPDHVAAMERHRHKGIDFVLITQSPMLIDPNIRRLCGKHIHIRSMWSGRKIYEWSEASNPENVSDRSRAISSNYKLPSSVFSKYKSSSAHVKQERKIPFVFWVVVLGILVSIFLGYKFSSKLKSQISATPSSETGTALDGASSKKSGSESHVLSASLGSSIDDYKPRLPARPETAPLYDDLRKPSVMPVVAGCMVLKNVCKCYTQQGTNAFLSQDACLAWIDDRPFNPYDQDIKKPDRPILTDSEPQTSAS